MGNFGEIFVDVRLIYFRSLLSMLGYVPEKVSVPVLWRVLYDSLCHGNPRLEEGSNTLEPFALDFGLVCMGFLYDCSWKLRYSNSVEESAI